MVCLPALGRHVNQLCVSMESFSAEMGNVSLTSGNVITLRTAQMAQTRKDAVGDYWSH